MRISLMVNAHDLIRLLLKHNDGLLPPTRQFKQLRQSIISASGVERSVCVKPTEDYLETYSSKVTPIFLFLALLGPAGNVSVSSRLQAVPGRCPFGTRGNLVWANQRSDPGPLNVAWLNRFRVILIVLPMGFCYVCLLIGWDCERLIALYDKGVESRRK
jgi:hypothetical protein